jgi:serine/threonine protein kinase
MIDSGTLVDNRYQILTPLGQGGLGIIYGAQDTRLHRPVALKFIQENEEKDTEAEERFLKEAIRTSQINHPNVITIHDYGHHQGHPFIVMEYMNGYTIRDMMPKPSMERADICSIANQMFEGLHAAHEMYVFHGDIQPANIMVMERGVKPNFLVKIFDFGLARVLRPNLKQTVGKDNSLMGSLHYMSPERFRGENLDGRADLYSVGIILYELLSGTYPWNAESIESWIESVVFKKPIPLRQRNPRVPFDLEIAIMTLIAKEQNKRFPNAEAARAMFTC